MLAGLGTPAPGFDPVSVRIDDERGVVVRAVLGSDARRTVVPTSGSQCCRVEGVDAFACRRREAEMQSRLVVGRNRTFRPEDPERDGVAPIPERPVVIAEAVVAERCEDRVIEALGPGDIPNPDRYVT